MRVNVWAVRQKTVAVVERWPLGEVPLYLSLKITGTHSHRLCKVIRNGFLFCVFVVFVVCDERCKKLQFFVGLNWRGIFMN